MPAFRPGGMSDSENSEDDYYYDRSQPRQPTLPPPSISDNKHREVSESEARHLLLYNKAILAIQRDAEDFGDIEEALNGGVNINESKENGWTFLHYACEQGSARMISYLLEKGADVNQVSEKDGFPPFLALCSSENRNNVVLMKECLDLLVAKGATLAIAEYRDLTPVMFAAKQNLCELVEVFLKLGVDVNQQDQEGSTALHIAAERGFGKVVRVLLQGGANVDTLNEDGQTAYDTAASAKFFQLANDLYQVQTTHWIPGADPNMLHRIKDLEASDIESPKQRLLRPQKQLIDMTLERIGLSKLTAKFHEHKIDFLSFLRITDDDLQAMGILEVGIKRKILDSVRVLHNAEWNKSSVHSLFRQGNITSPEVVCMLHDIKSHLDFMTQSMVYLQKRLKAEPKALVSGSERTRAPELTRHVSATVIASEGLKVQALALGEFFSQLEGRADLQIGDLVRMKQGRQISLKVCASVTLLLLSVMFITPKLLQLKR